MALDIATHISQEANIQVNGQPATAAQKLKMLNYICETHGYQAEIINPENPDEMIPNPMTKKMFFDRCVMDQIMRWFNGWSKSQAKALVQYEKIDINN